MKESDKLKTYLDEEGCTFEKFWSRVQSNAALWKRIQPCQVGGYYYVVKYFRCGVDGGLYLHEELPYGLVRFSKSLDVWYFGSLMFELITDESLFHSNMTRYIVNDSDFERLFNWSMTDYSVSIRFNDINNSLKQHLLCSLLTSPSGQCDLESILEHPFFKNEEDEAIQSLCKEIVQVEKEEE